LIGTKLVIESADSVPNTMTGILAATLPIQVRYVGPEQPRITISLAKYNILDLTFGVEGVSWQQDDSPGISALKDLHFAVHPEDLSEDQRQSVLEDDDPTCLRELSEDIDGNKTLLSLFLEALPRLGHHSYRFPPMSNFRSRNCRTVI
jgi:hypothetical protein